MTYRSVCSGIEAATVAWEPRARYKDRTGQKFGRLTAIKPVGNAPDGSILWLCRCSCDLQSEIVTKIGKTNSPNSCGCLRRERISKRNLEFGSWNVGKRYRLKAGSTYSTKHSWAKAVIATRGNRCERCGWDKARCDVHHKIPKSIGGLNTIDNAEVLCPNCHREEHGV